MKFEIVDDIFKSNHEYLSKLHQLDVNSIKGGEGNIHRSKLFNTEKARAILLENTKMK